MTRTVLGDGEIGLIRLLATELTAQDERQETECGSGSRRAGVLHTPHSLFAAFVNFTTMLFLNFSM